MIYNLHLYLVIIESNQTELIMAVRVAHARFKYDLQKNIKRGQQGYIISPNIWLILTVM